MQNIEAPTILTLATLTLTIYLPMNTNSMACPTLLPSNE